MGWISVANKRSAAVLTGIMKSSYALALNITVEIENLSLPNKNLPMQGEFRPSFGLTLMRTKFVLQQEQITLERDRNLHLLFFGLPFAFFASNIPLVGLNCTATLRIRSSSLSLSLSLLLLATIGFFFNNMGASLSRNSSNTAHCLLFFNK